MNTDYYSKHYCFKQGFRSLILAVKESFSFESTSWLENLQTLDSLINWGIIMINEKEREPDDFFSEDSQGRLTTYTTFTLLEEIQKYDLSKEISFFDLFFHNDQKETCNDCSSNPFVKKQIAPTTIKKLKEFLVELIPSATQSKTTDKAYTVLINLFNCAFTNNIFHKAVLVIATGNDNEPRAYFCDSCGYEMPDILKNVLIEHLGIKADNIGFSYYKQQTTEGSGTIFVLENSLTISDLMLDKKSFDEIGNELIYRPTKENLLEVREIFSVTFSIRFCKSLAKESSFFCSSLDKFLVRLEEHPPLLEKRCVTQSLKHLSEVKEVLGSISQSIKKERYPPYITKLPHQGIFSLKGQSWIRACLFYLSMLNSEYYKHLEAELTERLQKTTCLDCKERINEKAITSKKRKEYYLSFLENFQESLLEFSWLFKDYIKKKS